MDRITIFDTTLRDGEQSPGAALTPLEKLEVARALAMLGVDVIEAGFPAASPGDLAAVRAVAEQVGRGVDGRVPVICALARATESDINAAWQAIQPAKRSRIHTFLATSDLHLLHKLRITRAEALEQVTKAVSFARRLCDDVEFSAEDGSRSDPAFLHEVFAIAIKNGATTINLPDTVGYSTPEEYGALIAGVKANVPGADRVVISVHCHDDLGLATANTLAGLRAGARQAEVTINGIGERAGNCSLEEIVMALYTRRTVYNMHVPIDTTQLVRASRLVSTLTGMVVQPNKAIVGANAFSHESGIHQDGVLKNQQTYEIMEPETVGATAALRLVLGKHSGRHAFAVKLRELGYALEGEELDRAFARFKQVADRKKHVSEADLEALIVAELGEPRGQWALDGLQVACGTNQMPTASARLRGPDGTLHVSAAVGTGPVDASFKAVDQVVRAECQLLEYRVHAVTEGIDALGEVSVKIRGGDHKSLNPQKGHEVAIFHGHGADTDIVVASVKAYLTALNKMLSSLSDEKRNAAYAV